MFQTVGKNIPDCFDNLTDWDYKHPEDQKKVYQGSFLEKIIVRIKPLFCQKIGSLVTTYFF